MAGTYPLYVYDLEKLDHTRIVNSEEEEKDAAEQGYTRLAHHPDVPDAGVAESPIINSETKFPIWIYHATRAAVIVENQKQLDDKIAQGYTESVTPAVSTVALDDEINKTKARLAELTKQRRETREEEPPPLAVVVEPTDRQPIIEQVGRKVAGTYKCKVCNEAQDNIGEYNKHMRTHRTPAQT